MDVSITIPRELLRQLLVASCITEAEARRDAAVAARWEADRASDRRFATDAANRLEKAEYRSQWLLDAVVSA